MTATDHDLAPAVWRTSTHSNNGGNCVEAASQAGAIAVRDTTQHGTGPVLRFPAQAWRGFTGQIKQP
jgi:Domain of unknown function (DUF397)